MSRLFESSKLKRQWPENLRNSNKMGWPTGTEEVGGAWYSYRNPLGSFGSSKQKATKTFGIQDVQVPDCLQRSRPGGGSKHRCEKQQVEGSRKKDTGLESQDYSGSWVPNPNSESLGQTGSRQVSGPLSECWEPQLLTLPILRGKEVAHFSQNNRRILRCGCNSQFLFSSGLNLAPHVPSHIMSGTWRVQGTGKPH